MPTLSTPTPVAPAARWFMIGAAALVTSAGVSLFFFSESTQLYFAWTIKPPATAAYLGGGYLTVATALVLGLRAHDWAQARIGFWVVATGLASILAASLLHLDKFHLHSEILSARAWAWSWMVLYVVLIPALAGVYRAQSRIASVAESNVAPLPGALRLALRALALLMISLGALLFVVPAIAETLWPWKLTPLTARMAGSFYMAIAVSLFAAARENDYQRIHVAAFAWMAGTVMQAVNSLLRYPVENWATLAGVQVALVHIGLLGLGALGARGYLATRRTVSSG
jgi:hypothetical protein